VRRRIKPRPDGNDGKKIQVTKLLHGLEIECLKVYFNFKRENEGDHEEIAAVEKNFETLYCPGLTVRRRH